MQEKFHSRLKRLILAKGYNQKEFAKKASLTEGQLSHYLSGYRLPETKILLRIAKALDVSLEYLLEEPKGDNPYKEIEEKINVNKAKLTPSERMALIMLLSKE